MRAGPGGVAAAAGALPGTSARPSRAGQLSAGPTSPPMQQPWAPRTFRSPWLSVPLLQVLRVFGSAWRNSLLPQCSRSSFQHQRQIPWSRLRCPMPRHPRRWWPAPPGDPRTGKCWDCTSNPSPGGRAGGTSRAGEGSELAATAGSLAGFPGPQGWEGPRRTHPPHRRLWRGWAPSATNCPRRAAAAAADSSQLPLLTRSGSPRRPWATAAAVEVNQTAPGPMG